MGTLNIKYDQVARIKTAIEGNRTSYYALWQWAALFSGSMNNIKNNPSLGEDLKGQESVPSDTKSATDPSILNLFDTASQYFAGVFFPENKPFTAKPLNNEDEQTNELFDKINDTMNEFMKVKETNFQDSKERSYNDYVILGTKALVALENPDDTYPFWVSNYSVNNMAFNANRDTFVLGYQWTADQIVQQLVGNSDSKEYARLPDKIRNAYENFDYNSDFKVSCLIIKNRDYRKGASGANGFEYMGIWTIDGATDIIKTDYYKERPIAESLYKVKSGEIYGRSPLTDRKSGFEIYDGVLYMIAQNIAKIGDPAIGYFDVGATGFTLDTSSGTMTAFNQGLLTGSAPTFKIQDAGDITPAVSYLQPKLYDSLRVAYGIDAMVDLVAQKRVMTATEVMQIENIRNKILAPRIRREVSELMPFKRRLFLLTARWLSRHGEISPEQLNAIETMQIQWTIAENSSVERIIQSENIAQYQSELNIVAASQAVSPKIANAVDLYDSLSEVLNTGYIKLLDKNKYQTKSDTQEQIALAASLPKLQPQPAQPQEE